MQYIGLNKPLNKILGPKKQDHAEKVHPGIHAKNKKVHSPPLESKMINEFHFKPRSPFFHNKQEN